MTTTTGSGKLNVVAFGLAIGVVKAIFLVGLAWAARLFDYGYPTVLQISDILHGYAPGFVGGIIGGFWGLVYGFIFGAILASTYNCSLKHKFKLPSLSVRKIRRKKR